jgi:hypothetical protein
MQTENINDRRAGYVNRYLNLGFGPALVKEAAKDNELGYAAKLVMEYHVADAQIKAARYTFWVVITTLTAAIIGAVIGAVLGAWLAGDKTPPAPIATVTSPAPVVTVMPAPAQPCTLAFPLSTKINLRP